MSAGVCSALALAAGSAGAGPAAAATASGGARSAPVASPIRTTGSRTGASSAEPVIIFLKKPRAGQRSRTRSAGKSTEIQAAQAPYVGQLQALGATRVHAYRLVDAISARVPGSALAAISASPGVASVIPDSPIAGPIVGPSPAVSAATAPVVNGPGANGAGVNGTGANGTGGNGTAAPAAGLRTPPGACSATPQLAPEGLALTRTDSAAKGARTARSLGFTGAGVKVAFTADGIDTSNANLMRGGKPVISDYQDFSGDGSDAATAGGEAFLDANAIAGQGSRSYDVAGFAAQVPASPCRIRIEGTAPGVSLVALKVFSSSGVSSTSGFLQAIDYAVTVDHVNVLNESFGSNPFPDITSLDAVKEFNDAAVRAGTTVVVASGDAGPFNTIGSPASDPRVISVGASTDFQFYAQTGYAGADQFAPAGWDSDNISSLSSGGYTQDGRTLDLVAPGDLSFASCTPTAAYADCLNFRGKPSPVEESGGTSESAPTVAGAAALVIQAYARAHHGTVPGPAAVKQILLSTATDLGAPATEQGTGLLNSLKAVELASWRPGPVVGGTAPAGPTLKLSANQLNYAGKPGATASWSVTVTNTGPGAQTVGVSGRGFGGDSVVKQATVALSDTTSPHFTNWAGTASNFGTVKFTVPPGQSLLNASIAWPASPATRGDLNARVRAILVDPAGRLAAHSLPQGVGGYGSAQVLRPAAGNWTAVIFSDAARAGGTAGTVRFGASVSSAQPFGTVSPSRLVLAPGASGVVRVSALVPAGAGDSSGSVVFTADGAGPAGPVSVPVTVRGQVQAGFGVTGRFSGVLTGGNGRAPGQGQVAAYTFTVPPATVPPATGPSSTGPSTTGPTGQPGQLRDLDVDVTLANDPANEVSGYLVAPDGETTGYGSNYLTTGFDDAGVPAETPGRQLSMYASNPIPGTWTVIIDFTSPVPGNELADPFAGLVRFNTVQVNTGQVNTGQVNTGLGNTGPASQGGLPDSPAVSLTRGKPVTYKVTVRNTGAAPEDIFLDPRLTTLQSYTLQPQDQVAGLRLPLAGSVSPPEWVVPTMTHSVYAQAISSVPVMFDFGPFPGDPDEASSAGLTASASYPFGDPLTPVTQGLWYAVPDETGPYPASGAPGATVTADMSAVTQQFDTSASPATGDFWRFSVSALAASASYSLFVINPGQTRSISLTVTPSAPSGTVVSGVLYVDDFVDSLQFLSGSQLAALPYRYTVR